MAKKVKASTLLRRAKKYVKEDGAVCISVRRASDEYAFSKRYDEAQATSRRLRDCIGDSIGTSVYVTQWLRKRSAVFRRFEANEPLNDMDWSKALLDYRLRWIDWMIEGYKAVGD